MNDFLKELVELLEKYDKEINITSGCGDWILSIGRGKDTVYFYDDVSPETIREKL